MLLTGTVAAQIFPALAAPLITRVYRPLEFGAFAIALAAFGVLAPIVCLRYDIAVVLPEHEEDAAPIAGLCLAIAAAWALALVLPLVLAERYAPQPRYRELALLLLAMLPASLLMQGCQTVAQAWSLRIQNFRAISVATASQSFVTVVCQLLFGKFIAASPFTLIAGALMGNAAAVLVLLPVLTSAVLPAVCAHAPRTRVAAAAREYRRFPLITGPYAFFGQASARGTLIVLSYWVSAAIVGQYALAQRITLIPVVTVAAAMSQVFYSRAARRIDERRTSHVVRAMLCISPWIVGPFFMLLMLFGTPIFAFAFGAEWAESGRLAGILAAASLARSSTAWLDRIFDIRAKQHLALAMEALFAVLGLAAMYVVLRETHDVDAGVAAYVVVTVIFFVLWMMIALHIAPFPHRIGAEFLASALLMVVAVMGFYEALRHLGVPLIGQFAGTALAGSILASGALRYAAVRLRQA
jgi:O-antigen/teichoic acid export membrane protein